MVSNPNFFSTSSNGTPLNQIRDAVDFPHTGLIKALNGAMSDRAIISGCDITISNSSAQGSTGNNFVTVTAGIGIIEGKRCGITGNAQTIAASPPVNSFHLVVAPKPSSSGSTQIVLRTSTTTNTIPDLTAGDTIVAVIKYLGGSTAPEIQYLTADKKTNSLSIAREDSSVYTEGLTIQSTTNGDIEIEGKEQDKDIIFKANDGGTPTEVMRIDGSTSRIGIGTNTPATMLHLKSSGTGEPKVTLENSNDDSQEPQLEFKKNGTSPANSDDLGIIRFVGDDSNGSAHLYAYMMSDAENVTAGAETGRIFFFVSKAGTTVEMLGLSHDEIVVNEAGEDTNFRVESDTNANMLFVDAGNDRVGIGTNTPSATLEVATGGTFRTPRLPTVGIGSPTTLTEATHAGAYLLCGANVTLPATSSQGEHYTILNTTTGNITVARNGNNINNAASDITVATHNGVTCIAVGQNDWIALGV